ncbi:MAG: S-layer homology domain-containing protein [Oscillospiraceae bacterium]
MKKLWKRLTSLAVAVVMTLGLGAGLAPEAEAWETPDPVTVITQTEKDAKATTTVYSACGSLFWDPSCWTAVEKIDNIWLTISGNEGYDLWDVGELTVRLTLPDGFEFHLSTSSEPTQTYDMPFHYTGSSGENWWIELPAIYPTYVADAQPGQYFYIDVVITGSFWYTPPVPFANAQKCFVNTGEKVPFAYIADAWDSVEVSHPDIGSYTINWASEDAYQANYTYDGSTAALCAALSAISQNKDLTLQTLAKLGFTDFRVLTGEGTGAVNDMGIIIGSKTLTGTAYTIGVLVGPDDSTEWLGALNVDGYGGDYYPNDVYSSAWSLDNELYGCELSQTWVHGLYGAPGRRDSYILLTGFGRAGAVASVMANIAANDTYRFGSNNPWTGEPAVRRVTAYTFGAPNVCRQEHPDLTNRSPNIYNLVYSQDPICAAPSGQYYQALGETCYVLGSDINSVKDADGDGLWTDDYGVTYQTVNWVGDYTNFWTGEETENVTQCATVNELVAAALYAWDPYDPDNRDASGLNPGTVNYLAQISAVLGQYGLSLNDVNSQAHTMRVYWQAMGRGWNANSTNNAQFHWRLYDLYDQFFAPESGDTQQPDKTDDPQTDPAAPSTPDTPTGPETSGGTGVVSMECHTFEGECGVTVKDSSGQTVASITAAPYDTSKVSSSGRFVTAFTAGSQRVVLITDSEEDEEEYTIEVTGSLQDQDSTVSHTVYQVRSDSDTVTVLQQGDVTVSSGETVTTLAATAANITGAATGNSYARSTVQTGTDSASVSREVPALYTGNPGSAFAGFTDVQAGVWYSDPVAWAVEQGITNGTSETTFSPDQTCTRAQIITFLWRAAGSPVVNDIMPFTDVDESTYYAEAVRWAASERMVTGTTFAPDDPCTREMAVEFMWKYAGSPNAAQASFTDVSSAAVNWAVEQGITNGTSDTTFSPAAICTRAQIVTFLYRGFAE